MRTLIKCCFTAVAAGSLLLSLSVGAADSAKDKNMKNEPLEKCKVECLNIKDSATYEGCMLNCNKTHENKSPTVPKMKK